VVWAVDEVGALVNKCLCGVVGCQVMPSPVPTWALRVQNKIMLIVIHSGGGQLEPCPHLYSTRSGVD
jgi:hypothetical protein